MLLSAKYETIFLITIVRKENLMKKLLSIILNEEVFEFTILSNKLIKDKENEKGKEVDLLILVNNKLINIELNSRFDLAVKEKNIGYLERKVESIKKKK